MNPKGDSLTHTKRLVASADPKTYLEQTPAKAHNTDAQLNTVMIALRSSLSPHCANTLMCLINLKA
jgi:hypothetical protein